MLNSDTFLRQRFLWHWWGGISLFPLKIHNLIFSMGTSHCSGSRGCPSLKPTLHNLFIFLRFVRIFSLSLPPNVSLKVAFYNGVSWFQIEINSGAWLATCWQPITKLHYKTVTYHTNNVCTVPTLTSKREGEYCTSIESLFCELQYVLF